MAGLEGIGGVRGVGGGALGQELLRHARALEDDAPSFADTLKNALGEVSELQEDASDAIGAFLNGEPIEIHEVMAATEEAGIALTMLIEIRNKLTEAYRTVSQMQQ